MFPSKMLMILYMMLTTIPNSNEFVFNLVDIY